MDGLNSNLNLHGSASPLVVPGLSDSAPQQVPTTRQKKRMRWLIVLYLLLALTAVTLFGWWVYTLLTGQS